MREKVFRNSSGFRFNVSFVDCTSVFVKSVLETYLLARGYNNNFLEKQFLRAANISNTNALQTKPKASNDVVPYVVTYNPVLPCISNILRKHFNILHSSNWCKC